MLKTFAVLSAFVCVAAGMPAAATIVIYSTPGALQPDENVLFQGPPPSGLNAFGVTNQTNTAVTFTGNEALATPSSGQARITAADNSGLNFLSFALTDPAFGFKQVEFNIFGTGATATSVNLSFTDQFGMVFSQMASIGNGQNFFSAQAFDDQFITNVSFVLNGTVRDIRQVRIGGIDLVDGGGGATVPEPQSWALMILGFGMVGVVSRRRKLLTRVTA